MRRTAFERENAAVLMERCKQSPPLAPSEMSMLNALFRKGASATTEEDGIRTQLFSKADLYRQCISRESLGLHLVAIKNWSAAAEAAAR